ncbi:type II toxin-antitoxin system RelE/ParE family toxin [bacterium]|nr:type II toxin-antitoxin system RelE/ParE family toxin [bacterium]
MSYEVGFKPAALRQFRKLNKDVQTIILAAIELLADQPRPQGCKKLKGEVDLYRIRVAGDYRVVYTIEDQKLVVTVVKIGHRREVYR